MLGLMPQIFEACSMLECSYTYPGGRTRWFWFEMVNTQRFPLSVALWKRQSYIILASFWQTEFHPRRWCMSAGASPDEGCYTFMFPLLQYILVASLFHVPHPHLAWSFHLFLIQLGSKGNIFQAVKCSHEPDNTHCLVFWVISVQFFSFFLFVARSCSSSLEPIVQKVTD